MKIQSVVRYWIRAAGDNCLAIGFSDKDYSSAKKKGLGVSESQNGGGNIG
jgi:hypothetical protein